MKHLLYSFCLLIVLIQLYACHQKHHKNTNTTTDSSTALKDSITKASLQDSWIMQSFPFKGQNIRPSQAYAIQVDQASMGIKLEINQCGIGFKLDKKYIYFNESATCTEACCDSKEGQAFVNLLKGKMAYKLNANELIITSSAGPIILSNANNILYGSQWTAVNYTHKKEQIKHKFTKTNHLKFEKDKAYLQLDVNSCQGSFKLDERNSLLEIGPMGCSRKCCDSPDGTSLAQALNGPVNYKIEGQQLSIETKSLLIVFSKKETEEE